VKELQARKLLFLHRPGGLRQGNPVPIVNARPTSLPPASGDVAQEALILEGARRLAEEMAPLVLGRRHVTSERSPRASSPSRARARCSAAARIVRHGLGRRGRARVAGAPDVELRARSAGFLHANARPRVPRGGLPRLRSSRHGAGRVPPSSRSRPRLRARASRAICGRAAADTPVVFWRMRRGNPIAEWYDKLCDGLARFPEWTVYWKAPECRAIPAAIDCARPAAGHSRRPIAKPPRFLRHPKGDTTRKDSPG
jgi:hypothetical protein